MGTLSAPSSSTADLHELAKACVLACDADTKCALSRDASALFTSGQAAPRPDSPEAEVIETPGYPESLQLVPPSEVPRRKLHRPEGRIALIHSLAHIEFTAVNLAWDAVYRFRGLPEKYYLDWVRVASEETAHFTLLAERLAELGASYGELPAHAGLWEMADRTRDDLTARMALIPRVLEARGLDVTPGLIKRLKGLDDQRSVVILETILHDEIEHVAIGSRWFTWACERDQVEPRAHFNKLVKHFMKGRVRGPFNLEARQKAGFSEEEMQDLAELNPVKPRPEKTEA
jgi:uncharacterized ferritin-like protein (DUF455 family)